MNEPMVHFIGAGPGDPELVTVKGARLLAGADLVLYAGSLVPPALVASAKAGAQVVDSAPLTLEQTHTHMVRTVKSGGRVARVHAGDPSLYGAVAEQGRLLDREGIAWAVVPGVSSAAAAAAAAKTPFTVPDGTQSLILTRLAGRTPVPEAEALEKLAAHGSALAVYLSAHLAGQVQNRLLAGGFTPDTPVILAHRVGWPEEKIRIVPLKDLAKTAEEEDMYRQTVFVVAPGGPEAARSKLYHPEFSHGCRK